MPLITGMPHYYCRRAGRRPLLRMSPCFDELDDDLAILRFMHFALERDGTASRLPILFHSSISSRAFNIFRILRLSPRYYRYWISSDGRLPCQ